MSFVLPSTTDRAQRSPLQSALNWRQPRFQHAIPSGSSYVSEHPNPWAALTARSGSSIMKLLRVFILCLAASGTARADEAAQWRGDGGTFLPGNVNPRP